jgi:hypothetical protein
VSDSKAANAQGNLTGGAKNMAGGAANMTKNATGAAEAKVSKATSRVVQHLVLEGAVIDQTLFFMFYLLLYLYCPPFMVGSSSYPSDVNAFIFGPNRYISCVLFCVMAQYCRDFNQITDEQVVQILRSRSGMS